MTTESLCSGIGLSTEELINYYSSTDCPSVFSNILNTLPDGSVGYNQQNLAQVQNDVRLLFDNFLGAYTITEPSDVKYSPFQNKLLDICKDPRLPGVCDNILNQYCAGYSRSTISVSPVLSNFCGCYAPRDSTYTGYVPKECDPLCHRVETIQLSNNDGTLKTCDNTVCVIDNVSINLSQTEINGGVTFSQVCPGCQGSSCTCIVSGTDLSQLTSEIGIGSQFSQLCGGNSVCLQNGKTIDCNSIQPPPIVIDKGYNIWVMIIIAVTVIVFILLIAWWYRREYKA